MNEEFGVKEVLPKVYEELRQLAASKMARERGNQTLQATALVHEAWLRVNAQKKDQWERTDFYLAAATAMRRILIEQVRRKRAAKRGNEPERETFFESQFALKVPDDELLAVHEALDQLAKEDAPAAELVQLRYFAGFNMQEAADALGISVRSAHRMWVFAKAWLRRELESSH